MRDLESGPDVNFVPRRCPRGCGSQIFTGRCEGMPWRLDAAPLTAEHAAVLEHYGVCVICLTPTMGGLRPRLWRAGSTPGSLMAPHVCGSPHSQREGISP